MKIIASLSRYRIWTFYWMAVFQIIFISAGNAGAEVSVYECSEDLEMPGVVIWTRMLVDSGQAARTEGVAIAPAGDGSGGFLVAGSARTDAGDDEYGLAVKMDLNGDIVDAATFLDINNECAVYDIRPVFNESQVLEGYIATGYKDATHKAPGEDNWWDAPDAWLMKLDLSLDMDWENTFGMQGDDWARAVLQNDEGYLFGGVLRDIGTEYGGWLFQTDDDGNGQWSKSLYYYCSREDEKDDVLTDSCPEPNISSSGDSETNETIHSLLLADGSGSLSGANGRMTKFSAGGVVAWTAFEPASSIIETEDGFLGIGISTLEENPLVLTLVSASGEELWSTSYGKNAQEPDDTGRATGGLGLVEAPDGGFILAARLDLYNIGRVDLWLIKTLPDTEGTVEWAIPVPGMTLRSARPLMMADDGNIILVGSAFCDDNTRLLAIKVRISNLSAPEASFTISPGAPYTVDQEITFDGRASSDPDGQIATYEWDFGDGTTGNGETDTHRYSRAGEYTVTLRVTDSDGIPAFTNQTVTVGLPEILWDRKYANDQECLELSVPYVYHCGRGVRGRDLIEGVDGGFVITGTSNFLYSEASYNGWLLKTFDNGILEWEKNLTNDPDIATGGGGLATTLDGGYVIAGTYRPYDEDEEGIHTTLIKTDSRGNIIWSRVYDDYGGAEDGIWQRNVLSLDNGEYAVGGHRWQDGTTDSAMWLLRTDADGLEIPGASHLYPSQNEDYTTTACLELAQASPEGFVLTGYYGALNDTTPLPVFKTDMEGVLSWYFEWPEANWNRKNGQWIAAVDDGYIVAGQSNSNYGRAAVMKVSSNGSGSVWVSNIPFENVDTSAVLDGAITSDGGIAVVGWAYVRDYENSIFGTKMFVARFKSNGEHQWHQIFDTDADYAFGMSILVMDDGSLVLLGDECNYNYYGCRSRLIKIGPSLGPVAAFDMDVREGEFPLEVQFSDLTSGGSPSYTYAWDFDNNGTVDSTEQNPVHTYDVRGTYSPGLTITDDSGRSDTFVCEDCVVTSYSGVTTDADGVEIVDYSVTGDAAGAPDIYDFQLAPEGIDQNGAYGFTVEAAGPDGSHVFQIAFSSPLASDMKLYKLPGWEELDYTVIDAYTIEAALEIVDGEMDYIFVLAGDLPFKQITLNVEGNGTTDPSPGTHGYYVDSALAVIITPIPDEGWVFDHWSGDASGSSKPLSLNLEEDSEDLNITAHFVLRPEPKGMPWLILLLDE